MEGTKDGAGQDPSLAARASHVPPVVEEASGILSGAAAGTGERHGELPGSLPSQSATLRNPRLVMLSGLGIGSHARRALTRVSVRYWDVARAEATPVS